MPSLKAVAIAVAIAVSGIQATELELPPCLEPFRPYVYSGCFQDLGTASILQWRTPLDQQAMTAETCMATCKGNGFRYAGLTYYGVCYCGQTVKGPQVDESLCNYPCTGNSSQTCGGNNVHSVFVDPSFIPIDDVTIDDYDHVGCWTDDSPVGRALTYRMDIDGSTLTAEKCLAACRSEGHPFAGTEFGEGECYCGNVIANDTRAAPEIECTMHCNGDATQTCGGSRRLNLYVADELKSLEPCGYEPPVVYPSSSAPVVPSSSAPPVASEPTSSVRASSEPATASSEPVISTPHPTITTPPTPSSSKTPTPTKSLCISTTTALSTCEYKCGNWCSNPLPPWTDISSCKAAYSNCKIQLSSCFHNAGWPGSLTCFEFATWCSSLNRYCTTTTAGGSKPAYCKASPPKNPSPPSTLTITTTCAPRTPTSSPTTTSKCPIPTPSNICKQPSNRHYNFSPSNPVGGIDLPIVTCNDLASDHARNPFKLYTSPDTRKCRSFSRPQVPSACAAACREQYEDCMAVYAETCRRGGGRKVKVKARAEVGKRTMWFGEGYEEAGKRCKVQYGNCLEVNKGVTGQGKCVKFGGGPW
ncbi:WSC domain-containing protein [Cercophora newfieldiana]|uniref:WSC domain-containing protein n=1 Tax=Cercophora newfieldiana TaxID=92897 RepID=A0AA39Y524_9PEZI|nr:WSC domain-containing protein [Cercophora newfieldiana]